RYDGAVERMDLGDGGTVDVRDDGMVLRVPEAVPVDRAVPVFYGLVFVGACVACVGELAGTLCMGASLIVLLLWGMATHAPGRPFLRTPGSLAVRLGRDGYRAAAHGRIVVDDRLVATAGKVERIEVRRLETNGGDRFQIYLVLRTAVVEIAGTRDAERA